MATNRQPSTVCKTIADKHRPSSLRTRLRLPPVPVAEITSPAAPECSNGLLERAHCVPVSPYPYFAILTREADMATQSNQLRPASKALQKERIVSLGANVAPYLRQYHTTPAYVSKADVPVPGVAGITCALRRQQFFGHCWPADDFSMDDFSHCWGEVANNKMRTQSMQILVVIWIIYTVTNELLRIIRLTIALFKLSKVLGL